MTACPLLYEKIVRQGNRVMNIDKEIIRLFATLNYDEKKKFILLLKKQMHGASPKKPVSADN